MSHGLTGSTVVLAAVYLLLHGVVKVVLVTARLRDKLWAYPWLIVFLLLFLAYQMYRIALHPTAWLIGLTVFELFMVWLTWREYQRHRRTGRPVPVG